jgi:hypothetical protein
MTTARFRTRPGWLLPVALAGLVLAPARARGQDPDEARLVAQGVQLRVQGQDEAAFQLFTQAYERYHTPRAQAQLGLAAQALGRWAVAETHLQAALVADNDPWIVDKRAALQEALTVVRRRLGSLEVLADVTGAEVLVDGQSMGRLPLAGPLRLAAGTVVVQVQAAGYVPVQRPVLVSAGQLARESLRLVRMVLPSAAPPVAAVGPSRPLLLAADRAPDGRDERSDARRRRVLYILMGATAVGAGLSGWSAADTLTARDRYVADPTEAGYRAGLGKQRRTNMALLGTGLVAAGTLAWGLITAWNGGP